MLGLRDLHLSQVLVHPLQLDVTLQPQSSNVLCGHKVKIPKVMTRFCHGQVGSQPYYLISFMAWVQLQRLGSTAEQPSTAKLEQEI